MGLVYLECKLEQYSYGWCIFKLKWEKTKEKWYLNSNKTTTKLPVMFLNGNALRER